MVAEPNGSLTRLNAGWQPGMTVLDWGNRESHAEPDPLDELVHALACGISGYVRKTGHESVVLGLSGGLDSALVATLAAIALGPEAVHGICMPSRYSSSGSLDDARDLAARLGMVHLHEIGIEPIHEALRQSLQPALGEVAGVTDENLQARARGVLVMGLANAQGLLPLATGNKSELAVGYSTLYGDMCGALLPLGDVFKSKCYELAVHINRHPQRFGFDEPPLPESTITKPPSAELRPDQQDADSLPTYDRLDRVLEAWIEHGVAEDALPEPDLVGEILPMVQRSEFKRRQAPVVLKVSPRHSARAGTFRWWPEPATEWIRHTLSIMPIRPLPRVLVDQIAAGEVVERPAGAVKELVENAVDAGATQIEVHITDGGRSLISVRDNGLGIARDELSLAVSPHATSKIATVHDLDAILTMGFRGEALASIGAVSRLTVRSQCKDAKEGGQIRVEGGRMGDVRPWSGAQGTIVEAEDLFHNIPARAAFLKSPRAEAMRVGRP